MLNELNMLRPVKASKTLELIYTVMSLTQDEKIVSIKWFQESFNKKQHQPNISIS